MIGHPMYSVSLWPERGELPSDNALSVQLQPFIKRNSDLLSDPGDPRCAVGLWYNADVDAVYVDVVAVLPDREEAIELALRYDQIAIYDLGNLIEINIGGSGNTPAGIPPAKERLPEMRQAEEERL